MPEYVSQFPRLISGSVSALFSLQSLQVTSVCAQPPKQPCVGDPSHTRPRLPAPGECPQPRLRAAVSGTLQSQRAQLNPGPFHSSVLSVTGSATQPVS